MITIYNIKPKFQDLLRPICKELATRRITANQVTVAAMFMSIVAGSLVVAHPGAAGPKLLIPLVLFLRMALNAIDGMLAREHGMKSPLGGILNELSDVVSDAALYLPLAFVPEINEWIIFGI